MDDDGLELGGELCNLCGWCMVVVDGVVIAGKFELFMTGAGVVVAMGMGLLLFVGTSLSRSEVQCGWWRWWIRWMWALL